MGDVFAELTGSLRPQLRAAAISGAQALGLWDRLRAPAGAGELARALGASEHRLAALLDVLALEGAIERAGGGRFSCAAPPRAAPPPIGEGWGRIAEVLRTGRPLDEPGVSGVAGEPLRRFHQHLREAGAEAARELWDLLAPELPAGGALLDLGSGAGAYAAAFLARDPAARAVLVDRPAVLELALEALGPLASRAGRRALDLLADPLPAAPVVLLANLLHLFGPADAAALVARAAAAAAGPGGLVVIKDLRLDDGHDGPPAGVLFSLNMALFTAAGRVHDCAALRAFCAAAGLEQIALRRLRSSPDAIVATGRAPGGGPR